MLASFYSAQGYAGCKEVITVPSRKLSLLCYVEGLDCSKITETSVIVDYIPVVNNNNNNNKKLLIADIFHVFVFIYVSLTLTLDAAAAFVALLPVQTAPLNSSGEYSSLCHISNASLNTSCRTTRFGKLVQLFFLHTGSQSSNVCWQSTLLNYSVVSVTLV